MNNLFSKYSKKFMGLALASLVFTACEKDEFTEANALDLELQRLQEQERIADEADEREHKQMQDMAMYQRTLDSLDRINAGGLVYYSVIPVDGSTSVFASGGRQEEVQGEEGATVTIAQYGRTIVAGDGTSDGSLPGGAGANDGNGQNGVYTFPMLRSGEVTVTIQKDGYTTANYIANLTPDGAVANGQITYVGNMVPIFNIDTEAADANRKMATVKGKVWYEQDLTNGVEEEVNSSTGGGVTFTSNIDVNADSPRAGKFWARYMAEANDEGTGYSNNTNTYTTKSGYIQRFSYEDGLTVATVGEPGSNDYALLVPSTSSGLPIKMVFSSFSADRTFYRNGKKVTTRHNYGPNVQADQLERGVTLPKFTFKGYKTQATGQATYTKATTDGTLVKANYATSGYYLLTGKTSALIPDLTIVDGTGTGAVAGVAALTNVADPAGFNKGVGTQTLTAAVTNGGSGYVLTDDDNNPSNKEVKINVARKDILTVGTASVKASATGAISNVVYITDGGYGFITSKTSSGNKITATKTFTNYPPQVKFDNAPVGGVNAQGRVVIDGTVGVVSYIRVTNQGQGYTTTPGISIVNGEAGSWSYEDNAGGYADEPLMVRLSDGAIAFNTAYFLQEESTSGTTANFTNLNFATVGASKGGRFTFTPSVGPVILGNVTTNPLTQNTATQAVFTPSVGSHPGDNAFGKITDITIAGGGSYNFAQVNTTTAGVLFMSVDASAANANATQVYIPFSSAVYGPGANAQTINVGISITPDSEARVQAVVSSQLGGATLGNYTLDQTASIGGLNITTGTDGENGFISSNLVNDGTTTAFTTLYPGATAVAELVDYGSYGGGATANATLEDALEDADFLFMVDKTTADITEYAWGFVDFSASTSGDNSSAANRRIQGLRFADLGSGYVGGQSYPIKLVPNLYRDIKEAPGATPAARLTSTGATGVNWPAKNNLVSEFTNVTTEVAVTRVPARLTLSITEKGEGYAQAPGVVIIRDGVNFASMNIAGVSSAIAGRVETTSDKDVAGFVQIKAGTNQNIININDVAAGLNAQWDAFDQQPFTVLFVDGYSEKLTIAFNSVANGGALTVTEGGGLAFNNAHMVAGKKAWEHLPAVSLNNKPTVTVDAPESGETATAEVEVFYTDGVFGGGGAADDAMLGGVKVNILEPGSGYPRGNQYYNWGDNDFHEVQGNTFAGQNFRIIGGIDGATGGSPEGTETNVHFDVYTGITYSRDVHYGTGKEIE